MDLIEYSQSVLLIYEDEEGLTQFLDNLKNKPKELTSYKLSELLSSVSSSKYDLILSGVCTPHTVNHDGSVLCAILKAAKPQAKVVINQVTRGADFNSTHLITQLKLSGFINIAEPKTVDISPDQLSAMKHKLNIPEAVHVIEMRCEKPSFEVGSSTRLKFKTKNDTKAVWKLDDEADEPAETIDPDELLDQEDLQKPIAGLRVCSTTGKRKACKDCSCGLAEELQAHQQDAKPVAARPAGSSCGSCYLGDAFRCASCPYLGMPAFKPGDKIQLSADQLKADL